MFQRNNKVKCFLVGFFFSCFFFVNAYEIENIKTETKNDFVLEPAKIEVFLDPGTSQIQFLNILNRTDKTLNFQISVEDFVGSQDPNQTVILKGEEKGPSSLKNYLVPEINVFSLKSGQKMILPVTINIPVGTPPGGLYGSVLISSQITSQSETGTGTAVISRLGALFFVNVNGEIIRDGELTSFKKKDLGNGKIGFDLLFANKGRTYLNPSGSIKIFDLWGTKIAEMEIETFFAMPDSTRYRNIEWNRENLFGRYQAVVSINRGYDNQVDEMTLIFWVVSSQIMVTFLGGLIFLILVLVWLIKIFNQKKQERNFR